MLFLFMCVSLQVYATCVQGLREATRGYLIRWNSSERQL